jgi:hypothetical protein
LAIKECGKFLSLSCGKTSIVPVLRHAPVCVCVSPTGRRESSGFAFCGSALVIASGSCGNMAAHFHFAVGTVVSHENTTSMGPTVAIGIKLGFPFLLIEWLLSGWCGSSQRWVAGRCHRAEFWRQGGIGVEGLL